MSFEAWLTVLLGERDYSFFLFGGRRVSTQGASESWQILDEVARREQEGERLVSAVVPPKLWAVELVVGEDRRVQVGTWDAWASSLVW